MLAVVLLHVVAGVAALALDRLGRRVFLVAAAAPATGFVWALTQIPGVLDGEVTRVGTTWVAELGLQIDLRLNAIALVMVLLITGIGVLVLAYSASYFPRREGLGRFAGFLTLFAGSMLGLVLADNLLLLFVFWELTSITSFLLIGFDDRSEVARNSALQALLVTGAGGLALLFGLVLIGTGAGTYSLTGVLADPPTGTAVHAGLVLILVGAFTKSAQVPFHGWLPSAMAAPTPVSAYLHSATMVKAGVFVVAVFAPAFGEVGSWRALTVGVGVATMLWGGWQSLRRHDLKLILAYGTIAALGAMVALFGLGEPKTTFAGVGVLVAHALYKAALFMIVGIVDHQAHSRDIRRLTGLRHRMPATLVTAAVAGASMASVPATLGFVTKEAGVAGLLDLDLTAATVTLVGILGFSTLTVAAVWRFLWGGFADKGPLPDPVGADATAPTAAFLAPSALLAGLSLAAGVAPGIVEPLVADAAASLSPAAGEYQLYAWPGVNTALVLSLAALAVGALLGLLRTPVERVQTAVAVGPSASDVFRDAFAALLRGANRVTRVVQNGSLPVYLAVILLVLVVVPGGVLVGLVELPDDWVWADSSLQAVAAGGVVAAAASVVLFHRRFAAVIALGAVGYSMAVLFVAQGAPDLALTQFLIETVVVVAFVLVLRRMPETFSPTYWRSRRLVRLAISAAVGLFVFAFVLTTVGAREAEPPTRELVERALPDAGGKNVVNVILTDVRALDTLGEITVLIVAVTGVASLVRFVRTRRTTTTRRASS